MTELVRSDVVQREVRSQTSNPEYEIISTLAKSANTCLYKAKRSEAYSPIEGDTVALKVLECKRSSRSKLAEQLRTEARLMRSIDHENVIRVLEFQETDSICFIAMEFANTGSLRLHLAREGSLSFESALDHMEQLLAGLVAIHRAGIIHGDIRPETLYLTSESKLKIGNFQLPSIIHQEGREALDLIGWGGKLIISLPRCSWRMSFQSKAISTLQG